MREMRSKVHHDDHPTDFLVTYIDVGDVGVLVDVHVADLVARV